MLGQTARLGYTRSQGPDMSRCPIQPVVVLLAAIALGVADRAARAAPAGANQAEANEARGVQMAAHYIDGQGTLVIRARLARGEGEFAWVLPVPPSSRLERLDEALDPFVELRNYLLPAARASVRVRSGIERMDERFDMPRVARAELADWAVLRAEDGKAVRRWLADRKLTLSVEADAACRRAARARWSVLVLHVTPSRLEPAGGALRGGVCELPLLRVRFAARSPVLPVVPGGGGVRAWVLSPKPLQPSEPSGAEAFVRANLLPLAAMAGGGMDAVDGNEVYWPAVRWPMLHKPFVALEIAYERPVHVAVVPVDGKRLAGVALHLEPMDPLVAWRRCLEMVGDDPLARPGPLRMLAAADPNGQAELTRALQAARKARAAARDARGRAETARLLAGLSSGDASDRLRVARHPHVTPLVVGVLSRDRSARVRRAVAGRADLPDEIAARLVGDADPSVRLALARSGRLGEAKRVAILLADGTVADRAALAADADAPQGVLTTLSSDRSFAVRRNVAANPAASEVLVAKLSADARAEVRAAVARRDEPGAKVLASLVDDVSPLVLAAVASREDLPARHVASLLGRFTERGEDATSAWGQVGASLARNAGQAAHLRVLGGSKLPSVVRAAVANPACPRDVLARRGGEGEVEVMRAILDREDGGGPLREALLEAMARADEPGARVRAACATDLPGELLAELSRDASAAVRAAVAANPAAPAEVLTGLADAPEPAVAAALVTNPAAPEELLVRLAGHPHLAALAATNPKLPAERLERIARSAGRAARRNVARHPRAPRALLRRLSRDPDREVAQAAWERLEAARRIDESPAKR